VTGGSIGTAEPSLAGAEDARHQRLLAIRQRGVLLRSELVSGEAADPSDRARSLERDKLRGGHNFSAAASWFRNPATTMSGPKRSTELDSVSAAAPLPYGDDIEAIRRKIMTDYGEVRQT